MLNLLCGALEMSILWPNQKIEDQSFRGPKHPLITRHKLALQAAQKLMSDGWRSERMVILFAHRITTLHGAICQPTHQTRVCLLQSLTAFKNAFGELYSFLKHDVSMHGLRNAILQVQIELPKGKDNVVRLLARTQLADGDSCTTEHWPRRPSSQSGSPPFTANKLICNSPAALQCSVPFGLGA